MSDTGQESSAAVGDSEDASRSQQCGAASGDSAEDVVGAKTRHLSPGIFHCYKNPPVIVGAEGCYLLDQSGRRYLDCTSGEAVMNAGHRNPAILNAMIDQAWRLQHASTMVLTEPVVQLAHALADLAPGDLSRCFFCSSGSEANETAMLLATLATGRQGFIALRDSLHGRTKWAMSVTGLDTWRTDARPVGDIHFAPPPFCARCPLGKTYPVCELACAEEVGRLAAEVGPENIAGVIAEPIAGHGGIVVPPDGYWRRVRDICDRHGMLLILDEVQTAMNRTGRWFACEHWQVTPDILTMANALGNGTPIAVTLATDKIAGAHTRPGASTSGANPVSCAAALATIQFHASARLGSRAARRGTLLMEGLAEAVARSRHLGPVRGKGLMIGVEVVDDDGEPDGPRCDAHLEWLKDQGFLVGKTGRYRNVLTLMPPLTISEEQVRLIVAAFAALPA